MKKDLRISLIQSKLSWEKIQENRTHLGKMIGRIRKNSTDIILLPEMFSTGFTMNARSVAETMNGDSVAWMKEMAANRNAHICGSLVIKERKNYFNRLVWVQPDGKIYHYDKRHLFRMAKEHKTYSPGQKKILVSVNGWNICPLVCYDLRFPVWSRSGGDVDLLIYVANWPTRRIYAWNQLLIARAIENQCFVAGLNRIGVDGKSIAYSGESAVLDPLGMPLTGKLTKEEVNSVTLPKKQLEELRKSFPVMKDGDKFKIL